MAYLLTHFFEGGTKDQYEAVLEVAHPDGAMPAGQTYHAAGPTEGGWLVVAVWDSKESSDTFLQNTLIPALQSIDNGIQGPPQERTAEIHNEVRG